MPGTASGLCSRLHFWGGSQTVPHQGDDRRKTERQYFKYAALGTQFALTITLFSLGGVWLDGRFETDPLWTVVLSLIGIVGGMLSIIYTVK